MPAAATFRTASVMLVGLARMAGRVHLANQAHSRQSVAQNLAPVHVSIRPFAKIVRGPSASAASLTVSYKNWSSALIKMAAASAYTKTAGATFASFNLKVSQVQRAHANRTLQTLEAQENGPAAGD